VGVCVCVREIDR